MRTFHPDKKHWAADDLSYHESKKGLKSEGKGHRDLPAQFTDAKPYALISKVTALKKERRRRTERNGVVRPESQPVLRGYRPPTCY